MKVIIDGLVYSGAPIGGSTIYFTEVLRRITHYPGVSVEIYTPKDAIVPQEIVSHAHVHRNLIPGGSWVPEGPVKNLLRNGKRWLETSLLKVRTGSQRNAVFHSTYYTVAPWKGISEVCTIYDMIPEMFTEFAELPHNIKLKDQKKHCIEKSQRFIAISQKSKEDLCALYPVPPHKVDVVHLGVDFDFFATPAKTDSIQFPYVLYVGGRLHHKNFQRFAEAYAHASFAKDLNLMVAGPAFSREEQELIQKLGISDKVSLVTQPKNEQLRALYQQATLFVYPSLYEGFGLPILEAFAAGVPVAASRAGSIPEVGGEGATYFDPLDVEDMRHKMELMVASPNPLQKEKASQRARSFSWDKTAEKTVATYRRMLS